MLSRTQSALQNLAIYGLGDVATSIADLLLLPIYTRFLSPEDYGVIAMLLMIEAVAKILFRWGVDTAFMRMYYDCPDQRRGSGWPARSSASCWPYGDAAAGRLARRRGSAAAFRRDARPLISLVILNTFVVGFYFIPLQVLRINEQSRTFIALVFARSVGTLLCVSSS